MTKFETGKIKVIARRMKFNLPVVSNELVKATDDATSSHPLSSLHHNSSPPTLSSPRHSTPSSTEPQSVDKAVRQTSETSANSLIIFKSSQSLTRGE